MRIHRFIIALLLMGQVLGNAHVPTEVMPLMQTLSAQADITVIDTMPLGQSLAAQSAHITHHASFQNTFEDHRILQQMLGVITAYVLEQEAWLSQRFVLSWQALLQCSLVSFPMAIRGAHKPDLSAAIHEVVTAVAGATKAVVVAVTACIKLLKEVRAYVGTRSPQLLDASFLGKKKKSTSVILGIAGVCTVSAVLLAVWLVRYISKKEFSSHQHRDTVPTTDAGRAGRLVPAVMATTNSVVRQPAVPARPATPNTSELPRCLKPLVVINGRRIDINSSHEPVLKALFEQKMVARMLEQPTTLSNWFESLFAQRQIVFQPGSINASFKAVLAKLFFSKRKNQRVSSFTKELLARCAWALRQFVATGTPTATCSRPVATIVEPAAIPVLEAHESNEMSQQWASLFGAQEDAFYEAYLFLTSRAVQAVRERVGIASPPAGLANRLCKEMVSQFINAVARTLGSTNARTAERTIAEHIFYGLQRYERLWQPLVQEQ